MAIPVETQNAPAAVAMREFLDIVLAEDAPSAAALDGTELVVVLKNGDAASTTAQDIADLAPGGGGGSSNASPGYPTGTTAPTRMETFLRPGMGSQADSPATVTNGWWNSYVQGGGSLSIPKFGSARFSFSSADADQIAQLNGRMVKGRWPGLEFGMKARAAFRADGGGAPINAAEYWASFGFQTNDSNKESSDFALFMYHHNGTSVEFAARRRASGGAIATTALTYPGDGVYCTMEVIIKNGQVEFWLNGVLVVTDTTTLPSAQLREIALLRKNSGTTATSVDVAWLSAYYEGADA